jgi:hypothetical protein
MADGKTLLTLMETLQKAQDKANETIENDKWDWYQIVDLVDGKVIHGPTD